jgi:hypothetical protein
VTPPLLTEPVTSSSGTGASPRSRATLAFTSRQDVAVISGIRHEASIRFLCQSLADGGAFARYPALIIDLRDLPPLSAEVQADLDLARHLCLTHHQWLGLVRPGDTRRGALRHAQRWLRLLDGRNSHTEVRLRATGSILAGLVGVAPRLWNLALSAGPHGNQRTEPINRPHPPGRPS